MRIKLLVRKHVGAGQARYSRCIDQAQTISQLANWATCVGVIARFGLRWRTHCPLITKEHRYDYGG